MGDENDSTIRRVLRAIGWSTSVPWAALWVSAGIATGLDPSYSATLPEGLALGVIVGCLPWLPFWIAQFKRRRRRAEKAIPAPIGKEPVQLVAPAQQRGDEQLEQLSASIRDEWRRLGRARDLVHGFAEDGWVEHAALLDVDDHVARLRRLLEADERTNRLGGVSSSTLRRQVEELTALLVALADEAVEHQASLASDDPVPVTLAEARERLSATTQAYRNLQPPDARRAAQSEVSRRIEQHEASRNLQQPG